jgi:hypothetical protein
MLEQGLGDRLGQLIGERLRACVGEPAIEELGREWVLVQARAGRLPFAPDRVGAHWGGGVQVDFVAFGGQEQAILLTEGKWAVEPVSRSVVRELMEKESPMALQRLPGEGGDRTVRYALCARAGFTQSAQAGAEATMCCRWMWIH